MMNSKHPLEGNCLYFQSGGPTAVINTSFLGAYETFCSLCDKEVFYVSRYGITSLLEDSLTEIDQDLSHLRTRSGSYFGSARKMLPMEEDCSLGKQIVDILKNHNIRYVFVNGGNDSMDTAYKMNRYCLYHQYPCHVLGIPKTIDNDLYGTDHTPGYGSAAKFVSNSVIALTDDERSYRKGKILLIETMGRDSGYLAASSLLAEKRGRKPDFIYVPEVPFDTDRFLEKAIEVYQKNGHAIVVLSEGIKDTSGTLISSKGKIDAFGNVIPGGVASYLASLIAERGYPVRAVELNTLQRCGSFLLSKTDNAEAYEVGKRAVLFALEGKTGGMVSIRRVSDHPYQVDYELFDLTKCRKEASSLPKVYISTTGDNIEASFLTYVEPLVRGNIDALGEDGLLDPCKK